MRILMFLAVLTSLCGNVRGSVITYDSLVPKEIRELMKKGNREKALVEFAKLSVENDDRVNSGFAYWFFAWYSAGWPTDDPMYIFEEHSPSHLLFFMERTWETSQLGPMLLQGQRILASRLRKQIGRVDDKTLLSRMKELEVLSDAICREGLKADVWFTYARTLFFREIASRGFSQVQIHAFVRWHQIMWREIEPMTVTPDVLWSEAISQLRQRQTRGSIPPPPAAAPPKVPGLQK